MKATCTVFVSILHTLHEAGITTVSQLAAQPQLHARFWLAAKDFCRFALLSKTGGKNRGGEILPGNAHKVDVLERFGATTREDLEADCLVRIMEKLDRVLQQPPAKQKNYCYTICNNMVNDHFRKLSSIGIPMVSLDSPLWGTGGTEEDPCTYGDRIPDHTYDPERLHLEQESVKELSRRLEAKRAHEHAEKQSILLREVSLLSPHTAEVMARLACSYLGMKPRELAGLILDKGCKAAYAEVLRKAAQENQIRPEQLRSLLSGCAVTEESVKADSGNQKMVAGQISRLAYRADKRLHR